MVTIRRQSAATSLCLLAILPRLAPSAPQVLVDPFHQGPVHAGPDEVLFIPGAGFSATDRLEYRAMDPAQPADRGSASALNESPLPHALMFRLPATIDPKRAYSLTVVDRSGARSEAIAINEPRPAWISPDRAFARAATPGLARRIKLVGRNLAAGVSPRRLLLDGPTRHDLTVDRITADAALEFPLPVQMQPGRYRVRLAGDLPEAGRRNELWLRVMEDPRERPIFDVSSTAHGGCSPDDDVPDTGCLRRAIAAAALAGGGTVRLGSGRWILELDASNRDGVTLADGVQLKGTSSATTTLHIRRRDSRAGSYAAMTLMGRNIVSGITFREERQSHPPESASATLQLGPGWQRVANGEPERPLADITITDNVFAGSYRGVADGGRSIERLVITRNLFGAFETALQLGGDRFNVGERFRLVDSIIADNRFEPGGLVDVATVRGAIATEIGGSLRLDFSDNIADGTATRFLPAADSARGWRAGFFWHLIDSQENLLISRNRILCSGDLLGDGEAIALDNNGNTFAFEAATSATGGDLDSVTVGAALASRQHARAVRSVDYYIGHWLQIVAGEGRGQARRIVAVSRDAATGRITFRVQPRWDIVPTGRDLRVTVGRTFWQAQVVANEIDHRAPLCRKSNRSAGRGGGAISVWGQSVDSLVEANTQFETDGIVWQQSWDRGQSMLQWYLQVRDNRVIGEYAYDSDCSRSGIQGGYAAAPAPSSAPPVLGYGISITGNEVERADGIAGGAISIPLTWHAGPAKGAPWPLVEGTIIQHNRIRGIDDPPSRQRCTSMPPRRVDLLVPRGGNVRSTVLHANECSGTSRCTMATP